MRRLHVYLILAVAVAGALAGALALWLRRPTVRAEEVLAAYRGGLLGRLTVLCPRDGTLFPADLAPTSFRWRDGTEGVDTWVVSLRFADGTGLEAVCSEPRWRASDEQWRTIRQRSLGTDARLTVLGCCCRRPGHVMSAVQCRCRTCRDKVGAPIFYREVNLPFVEAVKDPSRIRWRFGPVSSVAPPVVLTGLPVCGNCHSFSADGAVLGMDVDYANDKGSYAVAPVAREIMLDKGRIITWSDYRRADGQQTFGLLSQVSPCGRYVVSTVKDRSVFVPRNDLEFSQLFFPIKGILAIHDRQTKTFSALPGADDPQYVQSNASWSPDGKHIVFARSKAYTLKLTDEDRALLTPEECAEFLKGGKTFRFDIYRVPFNGGKGGPAEPLKGASGNGLSNYFPRYSPDGRWIVFCRAKEFMLLQPDSELWIVPAEGGTPRRLACNTHRMNSWHSWSPNGRWLVFSSKASGPYTQLFLAHVDAAGRTSPAVPLEHFTAADRAANIPEFVNLAGDAIAAIREKFVDDVSYVRAGNQHLHAGDANTAIAVYRHALELNPRSSMAHHNLAVALEAGGKVAAAADHFAEAVRCDPNSWHSYACLGATLMRLNRAEKALEVLRQAVAGAPGDGQVHANLGMLLIKANRLDEAATHLTAAVRLKPEAVEPRRSLALVRLRQGRLDEAATLLIAALRLDPKAAHPRHTLALVRLKQGRLDEAIGHWEEVVRLDPNYVPARQNLGVTLCQAGRVDEGIPHVERAVRSRPAFETTSMLAGLFVQRGRYDKAAAYYAKALAFEPTRWQMRSNYATALLRLGRLAEAVEQARLVLKQKPDHVPAMLILASIQARAPDPKVRNARQAVQWAAKACQLTGQRSVEALRVLAAAQAAAGSPGEALATAQKALDLARRTGRAQLAGLIAQDIHLYRKAAAGGPAGP